MAAVVPTTRNYLLQADSASKFQCGLCATAAHIAFKQVALPQQKTQASYLMMIVDCLVPYTTELKHV